MITTSTPEERTVRHEIFQSIRLSIQDLHEDKVILEDVNGAPFLFKSRDAEVWARIFYRSMRDFSSQELQSEIKKLCVLMPQNAVLYLFYPELDRRQIIQMNGFNDRISFFEYAGFGGVDIDKAGVHICKWAPHEKLLPPDSMGHEILEEHACFTPSFLQASRLTAQEIAGLGEMLHCI